MQISPIKNQNFEKPSRNLSKRTKVKILKKQFFQISLKKNWFRVCSVTAEMFEHPNSGENRRKRGEILFENLRKAYKDLIQVKKKFKIISCLCTFNLAIRHNDCYGNAIDPGYIYMYMYYHLHNGKKNDMVNQYTTNQFLWK